MTPDRDTLARDLLALPALVGAPGEVVRGLCLRDEAGRERIVGRTKRYRNGPIIWDFGPIDYTPDQIHAAGWRVDLDAPATAGVLEALADAAGIGMSEVREGDLWRCDIFHAPLTNPTSGWGPTKAEARARALVEVARG